jgi:hypothetical protein
MMAISVAFGCGNDDKPSANWDEGSSGDWGRDQDSATPHEEEDGSMDDGSDADADADADPSFSVTWTGYSIEAVVTDGDPSGYYLSLAETGAGDAGWYGEDCISSGSICHEVLDSLSLACSSSVGDVESSVATLLCSVESGTSWAFWGGDDWATVVASGGHDPSYFDRWR